MFEKASGEMEWVCRIGLKEYMEGKGLRPLFIEAEVRFLAEGYFGTGGRGVRRDVWDFKVKVGLEGVTVEKAN